MSITLLTSPVSRNGVRRSMAWHAIRSCPASSLKIEQWPGPAHRPQLERITLLGRPWTAPILRKPLRACHEDGVVRRYSQQRSSPRAFDYVLPVGPPNPSARHSI